MYCRLSCFATFSRPEGQRLLLFSPGSVLHLPLTSPGDRSEKRVPFLKALSTGATALLSQAEGMPRQRGFRCMWVSPTARLGSTSSSSPQNISQRMMCFRRGFGLERTALRCCFLIKASVASGKKSYGRAGASWALPSRAPCSCPGFTLPGRTKQIQPQHCSSLHSLGWHSMHTTISQCRHRVAFYSGNESDSRTRPVLSPQERRGDRIHAHCPCTE